MLKGELRNEEKMWNRGKARKNEKLLFSPIPGLTFLLVFAFSQEL